MPPQWKGKTLDALHFKLVELAQIDSQTESPVGKNQMVHSQTETMHLRTSFVKQKKLKLKKYLHPCICNIYLHCMQKKRERFSPSLKIYLFSEENIYTYYSLEIHFSFWEICFRKIYMRLNCIASLLSGSLVVPSQLWYFTTIFANEKRIRWVLVYFLLSFHKQDKIRTLIQSKKNAFLNYVGLPLKRRNYIWIENPPKLILVRNTNLRVIIWRLFIRWPSTLFSFSLTSFLQSFVAPSICFASISMIYLTNMFFTQIQMFFFAQI